MNAQTQTRSRQQAPNGHAQQAPKANVPQISAPRLPYHPAVQERFGIDAASWRALTDAIFPAAQSAESVILALSYCKARKLDPFKRVVHIVPVWDSKLRRNVETVWPGIGELRATAHRTKQYAGCDATNFGKDETEVFTGTDHQGNGLNVTVTYPTYAQITVYRLIEGARCAFPGPRIVWKAAYGRRGKTLVPNDKWATQPSYMLEKVAEAAALRKAFPEELGNELSAEEMEGRSLDETAGPIVDHDPSHEEPKPTRQAARQQAEATRRQEEEVERQQREMESDYRRTMGDAPVDDDPPPHDVETGEIHEDQKVEQGSAADDPVNHDAIANEIIKKVMAATAPASLDAISTTYAEELNDMEANDSETYQRVTDAFKGKREALSRKTRR